MKEPNSLPIKMRSWHRYLGFFLAGVMAIYALSGIVLIFRTTNTFKREVLTVREVGKVENAEQLGSAIRKRDLKVTRTDGDNWYFESGSYNTKTGVAEYTSMELPFVLDKLTHLHKATTKDPLFFLNIGFGISLLFFVVSAFWMYRPDTAIFKKGMYFTVGGVVLVLILLFV